MIPLSLLALLSSAAVAADCPVASSELNVKLVRALAAFEERRYLDFEAERRRAERDLDCVAEVLRGQELLNLHQVWTLRALLDGDQDALRAGFRGLRVVAPGYEPPPSWRKDPDVMPVYLDAATQGPGRELRLPGRLVVDGHPASAYLPVERSTVVQIRNTEGSWSTWYVESGDPVVIWEKAYRERETGPQEAAAPIPVPRREGSAPEPEQAEPEGPAPEGPEA
jgi:hypothetical protein